LQNIANKSLYRNLLYEGRTLDIFSIESVAQQPRRRKSDREMNSTSAE
jgi:hypothetical protein